MEDALKVIYVAQSLQQAHLLKDVLRRSGIQAFVSNTPSALGEPPASGPTEARVVVHDYDAEEALQIALEFDEDEADEDVDECLEDEPDVPWPACPSCGRPRHTSCPVCETAGTDFPRAFQPDARQLRAPHVDGQAGLLVICHACDEPFTPVFLKRCEWCGHPFADGRELPPRTPSEPSEFTLRVWIVLVGLLVSVVGTIAFFAALVAED
jgi:hypothetical protein